jgi:MoaA/NifB/PqqE/SkfB family radical SAM enzyme
MEKRLNKRGVIYVTDVCNHKCKFCYYRYIHRSNHTPLMQIKSLADFERFNHNLTHVDITGIGEPTMHPKINEIIKYCSEINLLPTMITNGSWPEKVEELIDEGYLEDVVLSIHSVGPAYEDLTGGRWEKLLKTLTILRDHNFKWRSNVCVVKDNLPFLIDCVKLTKEYGGRLINFLVFNPHDGTDLASKENECQTTYTECAEAIKKAIDEAEKLGVLVEVRYIPICTMKGYEKYVLNFSQWIYDPYSWEEGHANSQTPFVIEEDYVNFINKKVSCNVHKEGCASCNLCRFNKFCDGIYPQYNKKYGMGEFIPFLEEDMPETNDAMFFRKKYMEEHPEAYSEDKW